MSTKYKDLTRSKPYTRSGLSDTMNNKTKPHFSINHERWGFVVYRPDIVIFDKKQNNHSHQSMQKSASGYISNKHGVL
jgi:hypothetical protein